MLKWIVFIYRTTSKIRIQNYRRNWTIKFTRIAFQWRKTCIYTYIDLFQLSLFVCFDDERARISKAIIFHDTSIDVWVTESYTCVNGNSYHFTTKIKWKSDSFKPISMKTENILNGIHTEQVCDKKLIFSFYSTTPDIHMHAPSISYLL